MGDREGNREREGGREREICIKIEVYKGSGVLK